jgi:hypothetical protein
MEAYQKKSIPTTLIPWKQINSHRIRGLDHATTKLTVELSCEGLCATERSEHAENDNLRNAVYLVMERSEEMRGVVRSRMFGHSFAPI